MHVQYNFEPNVLIVGYPSDMYISKRFSSDKIVSVTNKNIYRESLLTSSKLENFIKIKYFVFLFNEYQADGLNYTRNPGFKEKTQRKRIGAETQWKLKFIIFFRIIVNLFQSNIEIKRDKRKIRRLYNSHFLFIQKNMLTQLTMKRLENPFSISNFIVIIKLQFKSITTQMMNISHYYKQTMEH
ncbi:hypothetical protein ACJX0J_042284 [Zea mays]